MIERTTIRKSHWFVRLLIALLLANAAVTVYAQNNDMNCEFKVRDNTMRLYLPKKITVDVLNNFTSKYNIGDIGLYELMTTGKDDSLKKNGWNIEMNQQLYVVSKPIEAAGGLANPAGKIIFTAVPTPENWRVVGGNKVIYGVNNFRNYQSVKQENGVISFYLSGYDRAKRVRLAGSFTNWQYGAFPMTRTDDGWSIKVKLDPGPHYYKFIVNNDGWMTDPANELRENDGRGNINSLVFVTNKTFFLKGYTNAENVFLSGSFNNWDKDGIRMKKTNDGWAAEMYLAEGTHQYEFIVDGKVVKGNNNTATDESTTAIGKAYQFTLKGFENARKVAVAGNFNDWKPDRLLMKHTDDGWVLPYVLGPGNYQYKFIVDGRWITDPANKNIIDDGKGNENSFMVIAPNYTFRLKGYTEARRIYLAGDFNEWSERGLQMIKTKDGWECRVYLARGKHLYKFIVDGKWILDPYNRQWEENEYGTGNSVLWID